MLTEKIKSLDSEISAIAAISTTHEDIEKYRIEFLARKGKIASLYDDLKSVPNDQKPMVGQQINRLKKKAEEVYETLKSKLDSSTAKKELVDLTLPGRMLLHGTRHPITRTIEQMKSIFVSMGFGIAYGPEIEDDYHNFEALNFAPHHPARDMQDTFFIKDDVVLRTHTTPVQIRVMKSQKPPIRVIMPGRVYRNEAVSARSNYFFHQVDGLYVNENVTFAELKGTLITFAKNFYGSNIKYRFRPSYFPFTEPSLEMDITCFLCSGKGCRICKQTGWLEILGAGMVHPNVFRNCSYDPEKVSGFAFGMGVDRISLLRYGVDDIRTFFENDIRFLNQF
ncbi:MAG: phenylalanine--tRNA ligase subunit alpha [Ignavibacteriales bacterium]|nr:phenylalanine--tRNA ligase subunit alpha [Ignavibacteriales bacterium]